MNMRRHEILIRMIVRLSCTADVTFREEQRLFNLLQTQLASERNGNLRGRWRAGRTALS